jgi:hypothetical protein
MTDSMPAVPEENKRRGAALWCYYIFAAAASVAGAVLRLVLLLYDYDFKLGLYKAGTVLPQVFTVFLGVSVALLLTIPLVCRNIALPTELPPVSTQLTFVSALTGFAMFATVVMQLIMRLSFEIGLSGWKSALASGLEIAMQAFALPSAAYFVAMAVRRDPYKPSTAALGFFPVLWASSYLMCVYFDMSTTLNNPLRILEQASLIVVMAFMLMELRCLVGKAKPHIYITFGMTAMVMVTSSSLPTLLLTMARKMDVSVDTIYDAAKVCLAAYIAVRLADMIRAAGRDTAEKQPVAESEAASGGTGEAASS